MRSVIRSLYKHYSDQIKDQLKDLDKAKVKAYQSSLEAVFEFFCSCLDSKNADKPCTRSLLQDPDSPEVCLILYLYTIEPPFYADLLKACKLNDNSKLQTLGPFAYVLQKVMQYGYISERKRDDALKKGHATKASPQGSFAQSFLLFRGTYMPDECL